MKEENFRKLFYETINELIDSLNFTIVACVIKKHLYFEKYGSSAIDPYLMSLDVLVERFCLDLGNKERGSIIAESRGKILDNQLMGAWIRLQNFTGTHYIASNIVRDRISGGLSLHEKEERIAGLELADLVVSPIGRYILGKPLKKDF